MFDEKRHQNQKLVRYRWRYSTGCLWTPWIERDFHNHDLLSSPLSLPTRCKWLVPVVSSAGLKNFFSIAVLRNYNDASRVHLSSASLNGVVPACRWRTSSLKPHTQSSHWSLIRCIDVNGNETHVEITPPLNKDGSFLEPGRQAADTAEYVKTADNTFIQLHASLTGTIWMRE
jgi:hypothetical protein